MAGPDSDGGRATVHGVTIAEFQGNRICSLRQYWDEVAVVELLGADQPEARD